MYQLQVDVEMLNTTESVLVDISSVSPSSEQGSCLKCQPTHSLQRSAYPHQPYVDTVNVLPPLRRQPKLVLTGTSIPL